MCMCKSRQFWAIKAFFCSVIAQSAEQQVCLYQACLILMSFSSQTWVSIKIQTWALITQELCNFGDFCCHYLFCGFCIENVSSRRDRGLLSQKVISMLQTKNLRNETLFVHYFTFDILLYIIINYKCIYIFGCKWLSCHVILFILFKF